MAGTKLFVNPTPGQVKAKELAELDGAIEQPDCHHQRCVARPSALVAKEEPELIEQRLNRAVSGARLDGAPSAIV